MKKLEYHYMVMKLSGFQNNQTKQCITMQNLKQICNEYLHELNPIIFTSGMETNTRKRELVEVKQVYFYLLKEYTSNQFYFPNYTLSEMGRSLSKDHSTVLHSVKKIRNMIELRDKQIEFLINHFVGKCCQFACDKQKFLS